MTYSDFLLTIINGLQDIFSWLREQLFPTDSNEIPLFSNYLMFTILAFSILLFIIEELVGIFTSFQFGGIFFRLFRVFRPHGYDIDYKVADMPDYSKDKHIRPYRAFIAPFYRQKYSGRYFINYNNRYYPVKVPRFNPFSMRSFNTLYKAGTIISYDNLKSINYSGSNYLNEVSPTYSAKNIQGLYKFGVSAFKNHGSSVIDDGITDTKSFGSVDSPDDQNYHVIDSESDNSLWDLALMSPRVDSSSGGSSESFDVSEGGEFSDYFGISYDE